MVTYHFISNKGQCLCCTCTNIMVISIKMRMGGNIWDGTQDTYVEFSCCGAAYCMVSMVKSPEPICALACYICRTASNNSCKSFFPNSYNLSQLGPIVDTPNSTFEPGCCCSCACQPSISTSKTWEVCEALPSSHVMQPHGPGAICHDCCFVHIISLVTREPFNNVKFNYVTVKKERTYGI